MTSALFINMVSAASYCEMCISTKATGADETRGVALRLRLKALLRSFVSSGHRLRSLSQGWDSTVFVISRRCAQLGVDGMTSA
jgi:hypothetical protein